MLTSAQIVHVRFGSTRTNNRFTAEYEDDEPDGAGSLGVMLEGLSKEKDGISPNLFKFGVTNVV
jgi:hypothetical protein